MSKHTNLLTNDIYEKIEEYIDRNHLEPHDRLPSERYLSEVWNVNRLTLRDAIEKQGHDDVVLWSPTPEQPLPPYWMNRYMEISPGVWVPDDRPSPPGSVHPA